MRIHFRKLLKHFYSPFFIVCSWFLVINFSCTSEARGQSNITHQLLNEAFRERVLHIIQSTDAVIGLTLINLSSGETLNVNENVQFTQASVIKLQILLELFNQAKQGKVTLDDPLMFQEKDIVGGSGILQMLTPGKVNMTIRDIAVLMVIESDNTATNMIIDLLGMENVNRTLEDLGFTQTKLQRKMMDNTAWMANRENISTPKETAHLLQMIYTGSVLDPKSCDEILQILSIPKPGYIKAQLPDYIRVAHKTGEVDGVLNDAGIVYLENSPFIMCIMVNWLADINEAQEAIAQIALITFNYFDRLANSNNYGHKK